MPKVNNALEDPPLKPKMTAAKHRPPSPPATLQPPPTMHAPTTPDHAQQLLDLQKKYDALLALLQTKGTSESPVVQKTCFTPTDSVKEAKESPQSAPKPSSSRGSSDGSPPAASPVRKVDSEAEEALAQQYDLECEVGSKDVDFCAAQELTPHALYMRLKRLCEVKPSGKCAVDDTIRQQFETGNRDQLTLSLVMALKKFGFEATKKCRDSVRAPWIHSESH